MRARIALLALAGTILALFAFVSGDAEGAAGAAGAAGLRHNRLPPVKRKVGAWAPFAVGKLVAGKGHGTATVVGPRRKDGRWCVLTAAHCVPFTGRGTLHLFLGPKVGVHAKHVDVDLDLAWLATDRDDLDLSLSAIEFAAAPPKVGDPIWVCGYGDRIEGVHRYGKIGGNRYKGRAHFLLDVTFGDSGSPVLDAEGRIVGVVCGTTRPGKFADVLGVSWDDATRLRPMPKE